MRLILNPQQLLQCKKHNQASLEARLTKTSKTYLLVCGGTGCMSADSAELFDNLRLRIKELGLTSTVEVIKTGCFGFCEKGPIVKVMPEKTFYTQVKPTDAKDIINTHIVLGNRVERLLYTNPATGQNIETSDNIPFYKKQLRVALSSCGFIDPENIDEAIGMGAFEGLVNAFEMGPEAVISELKASGLRGRGGAGFPTGVKWQIASNVAPKAGQQKYVVCNADEGDPGAFMDRSVMEGDPCRVLEGMAICGYAINAEKGLIYIRAEYPLAIHRLNLAIKQCQERGLLGKNILGSGFNFDVELRFGAGAFVCGEETALIHSMEGKRGEPTIKPPYPAESGYKGAPTNVNNVETLANVPPILLHGAAQFASVGTEKSKGTKVFALAGKINNVGLIEVPMGTTLREVIYDIGGGIQHGKRFKAVQTGGPSGGCLTEKHLNLPIDFDNLISVGSMMGSGGMIVLDEDDCMVSVAKFYLEFTVDESCGKCVPCRIGNKRMHEILTAITEGKADMEQLDKLKNLATVIKETALCGLGQTSPNPVLSTIENFYQEYIDHIENKHCSAKKCKALAHYAVDATKCVGCTVCARNCPVEAISGERKAPHVISDKLCIRCGACMDRCKFNAITLV